MAKQKKTRTPYVHQAWPSWRYGPNGQAQIFEHEEQVPEGWEDHPSKVAGYEALPEGERFIGQEPFPPKPASSAAAEHSGTPETDETEGGGTTGGELGQTTDNTNLFTLPPVDEVDKTWVIQQLNTRKIVHNPKWRLQKLYDLLRDAVAPAQD